MPFPAVVAPPHPAPTPPPPRLSPFFTFNFSLLTLLLPLLPLLLFLGQPPVERTQEARVLETARQMLGTGFRGWMVPYLNGEPRLKKPPLAYWMAAGSYQALGVSEFAGRLPTAIVGALTLLVTALAAARLFSPRAALLAAATLLSSYLFFQHNRLAETDAPATLGVTLAVYALLPFIETTEDRSARIGTRHLAFAVLLSLAFSIAALGKGPPALFPLLFLVAYSALARNGRIWLALLRTGVPIILALLVLPWWIYVFKNSEAASVFGKEFADTTGGRDHGASFLQYFAQLLAATAPWSPLILLALIDSTPRALAEWRSRRSLPPSPNRHSAFGIRHSHFLLLLWTLSIFLPLCFTGNKQFHYLLPLMPPLAIYAGYVLDAALTRALPGKMNDVVGWVTFITLACTALGSIAILVAARKLSHTIHPADIALAAAIAALALGAAAGYAAGRQPLAVALYAAGLSILLAVLLGLWVPNHDTDNPRSLAARIQSRFGAGPYCFYGPNRSLQLSFNLRSIIPRVGTEAELLHLADAQPGLVVIAQTKSNITPPPLPPRFALADELVTDDQKWDLYRALP